MEQYRKFSDKSLSKKKILRINLSCSFNIVNILILASSPLSSVHVSQYVRKSNICICFLRKRKTKQIKECVTGGHRRDVLWI